MAQARGLNLVQVIVVNGLKEKEGLFAVYSLSASSASPHHFNTDLVSALPHFHPSLSGFGLSRNRDAKCHKTALLCYHCNAAHCKTLESFQ